MHVLKKLEEISISGSEACRVRKMFEEKGMCFEYDVIMPHTRIPVEGYAIHEADEFCHFIKGQVIACNDGVEVLMKPGCVNFNPKGEPHWTKNDTDEECHIVTVMLK